MPFVLEENDERGLLGSRTRCGRLPGRGSESARVNSWVAVLLRERQAGWSLLLFCFEAERQHPGKHCGFSYFLRFLGPRHEFTITSTGGVFLDVLPSPSC